MITIVEKQLVHVFVNHTNDKMCDKLMCVCIIKRFVHKDQFTRAINSSLEPEPYVMFAFVDN